ncbi:MAG: toxin-antitoxin system HicB family antitoxin [Chloroflexi bacterium]|nr:toxin-antitoxin system HicB family antitoxin [Chloroflexota bacterium]
MNPLTVPLPQTLRYQLEMLAQREGVSLDQYILYALARQVSFAYTITERTDAAQQRVEFTALLQSLGHASDDDIQTALAERTPVAPARDVSPETLARVRERIATATGRAG